MQVCIVGNGPSAKGHGAEIDACDFVVRMKAFWSRGAENAGEKIDAWAWFGLTEPKDADHVPAEKVPEHVPPHVRHWFTDCMEQIGKDRQDRVVLAAGLSPMPLYHISNAMRNRAARYLHSHPTTGFLTICMALDLYPSCELVLYGFDGLASDQPNYNDARGILPVNICDGVDMVAEKRAIAELLDGQWMGKPSQVKLTWPDMPEIK